jgi:hypothetical protein
VEDSGRGRAEEEAIASNSAGPSSWFYSGSGWMPFDIVWL